MDRETRLKDILDDLNLTKKRLQAESERIDALITEVKNYEGESHPTTDSEHREAEKGR